MSMLPFQEFPKIPRLKRDCVITEKVDGSNAQIYISETTGSDRSDPTVIRVIQHEGVFHTLRAGSRSRWIWPGKDTDNFGFAIWVSARGDELVTLGMGQHFGEWYGAGIQRGYGLTEKRFALFNTARWNPQNPNKPACCDVVPVLYQGPLGNADQVVEELKATGSKMVPGYMYPEGVIVYHSASKQLFKQLIENDDVPKGLVKEKSTRIKDPSKGGRRVANDPNYTGPERRKAA